MLSGMGEVQTVLASPITALVVALIMSAVALSDRVRSQLSLALFILAGVIAFIGLLQVHLAWSVVVTLLIYGLAIWARPEVIPRHFGEITPNRKLLFGPNKAAKAMIEIGDSTTNFSFGELGGKFPLATMGLTVEVIRGRIMISTSVTDQDGKVVAEILRNQWRAPPPRAWDRNYSRDAVEVKNDKGDVVLQVVALPDRVQIQAEWWEDAEKGYRLVSPAPGAGAAICVFGKKFRPAQAPKIRPLFAYPSEKNLGKKIR